MTTAEKTRETRLRRMAKHQGLALRKNRRRDQYATDYGLYWLASLDVAIPEQRYDAWAGYPDGFTLDQVEIYLKTDPDTRDEERASASVNVGRPGFWPPVDLAYRRATA